MIKIIKKFLNLFFNIKVKLFDKKIKNQFLEIYSFILSIISIISFFLDSLKKIKNWKSLAFFFLILAIIYIFIWIKANIKNYLKLNIENTEVEIKFGDLFKEDGLKVIAFNEYFDTHVDDKIIARKSLNGFFIENYIKNIEEFDNIIDNDPHLNKKIIYKNISRGSSKIKQYKLGSIFKYNEDFLLTAFSHFDDDNRAYLLSIEDYLNFLFEFWNEVNIVHAENIIIIPLLGSGITRFIENKNISEQDLLKIILFSFKISNIKLSKLKIVISFDKYDKISLFKIEEFCDNF